MFYTLMVLGFLCILVALVAWVLAVIWIWERITDDQSIAIIGMAITTTIVPLLAGAIYLDLFGMP